MIVARALWLLATSPFYFVANAPWAAPWLLLLICVLGHIYQVDTNGAGPISAWQVTPLR